MFILWLLRLWEYEWGSEGQRLEIVPVAFDTAPLLLLLMNMIIDSFDEYDYWLWSFSSRQNDYWLWSFSSGQIERYEAVCGGDLDMETGQLESPNFPEDYQVFFYWWLSGGEYDDDDDYGDDDDNDDDDDDDDGVDDGDEPAWVAKLSREL